MTLERRLSIPLGVPIAMMTWPVSAHGSIASTVGTSLMAAAAAAVALPPRTPRLLAMARLYKINPAQAQAAAKKASVEKKKAKKK